MHSVITEKTEDTMKIKETEERRRKHEETMMFEDKKRDKTITYVHQTINIIIYKEDYR